MTIKTFYIETLGCQMNKSDSEKIAGILENLGYEEVSSPEEATLLFMNTCSIRAMSENKAYSYLGVWKKYKDKNPNVKIAMCGCVAQQTKENVIKKSPQVDLVFGTHNIYELPNLLKRLETEEKVCSVLKADYVPEENYLPSRKNGITAWLPIIEGCNFFCTYCVVPYTRGRQRSRLPEDIIKEAKEIAAQGYKEIILLGQTVDSYGNDMDNPDITLANLLRELNKLNDILRIRFVTSYPTEITDDLITAVRDLDKVCEFFHLPAQSGSTEVLKRMKRRYTRDEYVTLIKKIKTAMPDAGISSDFIVGFPGETEEHFQETISLIKEVVYDHGISAAYSPRRQTPAATWKDQVSYDEKKRRLNVLNDKIKETVSKSHQKFIGRTVEVLVEKVHEKNGNIHLSGLTRGNKVVNFEGNADLVGTLVNVKINGASIWSMQGEIV